MTAFFAWHRKHKGNIFSRSKIRNKNPMQVFLDFILFFNITVEIFGKKIIWSSLEPSKKIFLSTEYSDFGSKF